MLRLQIHYIFPTMNDEIVNVRVQNITGGIVCNKEHKCNDKISLPTSTKGIYIVFVFSNGKVYTQKIILE